MQTYYKTAGKDKQLNEIVMVGSHDAGITTGDSNTRTQDLDILEQAQKGARFFDLRVAAFTAPVGRKQDVLQTFHADPIFKKDTTKNRRLFDVGGGRQPIEHTHLRGGAAGLGLTKILTDAKDFVKGNPTEFLILKFDKSSNWPLIQQTCERVLTEDTLYTCPDQQGNLNNKTLEDLKRKVIILFTQDGWANCGLQQQDRSPRGVLRWKNLYKKLSNSTPQYETNFDGLQYYGKGGVSRSGSGETGKINLNSDIQEDLMSGQGKFKTKGATLHHPLRQSQKGTHGFQDPRTMGIMYWTTTGLIKPSVGIRGRNDKMWNPTNTQNLQNMWSRSYDANLTQLALKYSQATAPQNLDLSSYSSATSLKAFMPNIVMIDFVDSDKCNMIMKLNTTAATALTATFKQMLMAS